METDTTEHRVGVYGWSPGEGGVHHHRIAEPLRVLAANGITTNSGVELSNDILSTVDHVVAHTLHDADSSEAWARLAEVGSHKLILDVDDWMWGPDWRPFQLNYTSEALGRLFHNVTISHVVTTPSPVIADYLTRYNRNVWVVPNTIPDWVFNLPPARTVDGKTVVYQGSPSHERDWTSSQVRHLGKFLSWYPDWSLNWYGPQPGNLGDVLTNVHHHPWVGNVGDYYRALRGDIGIGPLRDTAFNRAKSGLRAQEFCALGVVPFLPDLAPYRPYIHHGHNGYLIGTGDTLGSALRWAAEHPQEIDQMSINARGAAAAWTTENNIERWLEAWASQ